ncbi:PREDICTED: uncharacterized protein LOC109227729 [Nicotiana attenuata]|uniref:uncharacterized protein LOC109227729 n=1 Tax=Nicotiana attenuata TaxID=49451 RepID=UPI000905D39F|nr:PREDICTED: uncharacterized protein LOC109227729 [Nicotiana attenuata]
MHLKAVFELVVRHQLYAKPSKCAFGVHEVEYLRHFISAKEVATDPIKISAVKQWPVPTTVKQLKGFLRLAGYSKRFIQVFGAICKPLNQLLRKDNFNWTDEAITAFEKLKNALATAPVLAMLDYTKPFIIETDASGIGIGVVLMQQGHPIAYIRRHFIVKTYQKALKYLLEQNIHTEFQVAGISKLMAFDFSIEYKKGNENKADDALSRNELRWKGRLVVGADHQLRQSIIRLWHSTPQGGHSGMDATIKRHKYDVSAYPGLLQPLPIPEGVWADISLDFIEGLPKSNGKEGVQLQRSTAYHPHTGSQTEVLNRTLETYLRCFCSDISRDWSAHLPLAEWWYNIIYHNAIKCTPYEVFYGDKPPIHLSYLVGEVVTDMVDLSLAAREVVIQLLKFHLARAQQRIKDMANKHRKISVASKPFNKLVAKYFGHYPITAKVGVVAYRLLLLVDVLIHPTFHLSQLKKFHEVPTTMSHPPVIHLSSPYCPEPEGILSRRLVNKGNKVVCQVLVKWSGVDVAQATWEYLTDLQHRFPSFALEGKGVLD